MNRIKECLILFLDNVITVRGLMMQILKLLSDGQFHSGEELGEQLGVSRAAVWKQIQKLQQRGVDVYSIKGKGYKLNEPIELLDSNTIISFLDELDDKAGSILYRVEVKDVVSSTNDVAMRMIGEGVPSGYVCVAEQQTSGRGRRGRRWVSPYGSNIYMSIT